MWIAAGCWMGRPTQEDRSILDAVFPHLNSRESFDELIWLCLLSCMSSLADIPCLDGLWDWYRFALRSTPMSSQFMLLYHFLVRKSFLMATRQRQQYSWEYGWCSLNVVRTSSRLWRPRWWDASQGLRNAIVQYTCDSSQPARRTICCHCS